MSKKYYLKMAKTLCTFLFIFIFALLFSLTEGAIYGAPLSGTGIYFEIDKNPIDYVEIFSEEDDLMSGEEARLSANVYPEAAGLTVINTEFRIIEGSTYAKIDGDRIIVNEDCPAGTQIEVISVVDGIKSNNSLIFTVSRTPVQRVEILNTENSVTLGGALKLEACVYPDDATEKHVVYSIVSNTRYMQVSYSGMLSFNGRTVPDGELSVTVRASSASDPDVYAEKTFTIDRPITGIIDAFAELEEINQQAAYSFSTEIPYLSEFFGDMAVKYSVISEDNSASIDMKGLLYVTPDAAIGSEITVVIDSYDGKVHYEQSMTVAPVYAVGFTPVIVTPPSVIYSGTDYYLPGDSIEFDVVAYAPENVSDINKVFGLRVSDENIAYVDGHTVVIRDISLISAADPCIEVTVYSEPNGIESTFEINVFIPVVSVSTSVKPVELKENNTYILSDILETSVNPSNAIIKSAYYAIDGVSEDIAIIKDGMLIIKDNLPSESVFVRIYAVIDGIKSNCVEISIYKPAHSIEIGAEVNGGELSDTNVPVSSKDKADTVTLTVTVDKAASINKSEIVVTKGLECIDGEIKLVSITDNGTAYFELPIKKDLISADNSDCYIKLYAVQDGVSSDEIEIFIYVPNENIEILPGKVDKTKGINIIEAIIPHNATSWRWEFMLGEDATSKNIVKNTGNSIFVPSELVAGDTFTVLYRAIEDDYIYQSAEWKEVTFTVEALSELSTNTTTVNGKVYKPGFNVEYSNDSKDTAILDTAPQLWLGRSLNITLKYGEAGKSITSYGMKIDVVEKISSASVWTVTKVSDDTLCIKLNEDAGGNEYIDLTIRIWDGEASYTLDTLRISSFMPLESSIGISFDTVKENKMSMYHYLNAESKENVRKITGGSGALTFELIGADDRKEINIDTNILYINSFSVSAKQNVKCSYTAVYNGNSITCEIFDIPFNINTVTVNRNGGVGGYGELIAVRGMLNITTDLEKVAPVRDGYKAIGYGRYIDHTGKVITNYSDCESITVEWVKITETVIFSADNGQRDHKIDDDDKYTEVVYPGLDRELLKKCGYTQISITIIFDCREKNDGYQDIWIYSHRDELIKYFTVEHGAGKKDTSWWSHTISVTTTLDNVQADGSFWLRWGAHGNFGDDWYLGYTRIVISVS